MNRITCVLHEGFTTEQFKTNCKTLFPKVKMDFCEIMAPPEVEQVIITVDLPPTFLYPIPLFQKIDGVFHVDYPVCMKRN